MIGARGGRWVAVVAAGIAVGGCGADADAGVDVGADADAVVDVDVDVDADAVGDSCPGEVALGVVGEVIPGAVVTITALGFEGVALAWSVDLGQLVPLGSAAGAAESVRWQVPADAARHEPEVARIAVVGSRPGCAAVTATLDVVVDWPPALRTIVVSNPSVDGSAEVAAHYAAFRGIPADHHCAVPADDATTLPGSDYERWLDAVMACVAAVGQHVHVIVPVYGVPYKVTDRIADIANPAVKTTTSLDALLVYGRSSPTFVAASFNPYYQRGSSRTGSYDPFVPFGRLRAADLRDYFIVARIDGADPAAAMALVDRTAVAEARAAAGTLAGNVYVDGNRGLPHPATDAIGSYEAGEWNIIGVENVFADLGRYPVVADYQPEELGTAPAPLAAPDALYYAGWYAFGHYNDVFTWAEGAIGGHLDSCSACDIRGERDWAAMALRRGITATFGAVNEPYVAGMPEYDQIFLYLLQGARFGEAAYEATRRGAWMMVWVGDPLYQPYPPPPP